MSGRVFFKKYDSSGKFPDGRVKLDVYFTDSQHHDYTWTPDWERGTRHFFLEAFRVEKLNRLRGSEVEKFKQDAREVLSEEEIESYDEFYGQLEKMKEGEITICSYYEIDSDVTQMTDERQIPISIEYQAKITEETGSLLNWMRQNRGRSGKWIIVDEKLFDVEWSEKNG